MLRIEDYALIGDCETAALVGTDGSVDWLCLPRFDSDSVFAKLLGNDENGHWRIQPDEQHSASRRYRPGSLILETTFKTDKGRVRITDFMPPKIDGSKIVRIVEGLEGAVRMSTQLVLRFDYGVTVPWISRLEAGGLSAVAGAHMLVLRTDLPLRGEPMKTVGSFSVEAGQRVTFVLSYQPSFEAPKEPIDPDEALRDTDGFWREWSGRCHQAGPYSEAVQRSLVTLKALTFRPTGGIVAAATTSLPEQIGGPRNWDYRFCWVRDATLTLLALMGAGYYDEARGWRDWLLRAVAGSATQLQIMYGVTGERRLTEWEVPWLYGYEGSKPVRIGNAAHAQLQLDVYGELMDALYQARRGGLPENKRAWQIQCALLHHLESIWTEPDEGIWEVRGGRRHFTYSKVMAWVAFDRAIKSAGEFGMDGPVDEWKKVRADIHEDVCRQGFDPDRQTFVQVYGEPQLDASLLLIPAVGFLPAEDARVASTISAIEQELMTDGFVRRYDTGATEDGLPPGEGMFLACSFWLADAYQMVGRHADAVKLFERLVGLCNDVGLLSEEYDVTRGRLVGNFPQAFSHIALVNTAHNLTHVEKPSEQRGSRQAIAIVSARSDAPPLEENMSEAVNPTATPARRFAVVLESQPALVTGANSGIGRAVALGLAASGADVVVNYVVDQTAAEEVAHGIEASGRRAITIKADVSDEDQVKAMFAQAIDHFGTLHILVNNAGLQRDAAFHNMTLEQWNKVIGVNLTGQFLCAREAVREFMKRGVVDQISVAAGKLVFMSSVHQEIPWAGHVNYASSKGGVMQLMRSIAQEVAPLAIRANGVAPGAIRTPINRPAWETPEAYGRLMSLVPYKRIGEPDDIAQAVAWLASDAADYVTGATLFVDGGMSLYPGFATGG